MKSFILICVASLVIFFNHSNAQWSKVSFYDFSVMDISNDTIIASDYNSAHLFLSTNNGDTWSQLNTDNLWHTIIRQIVIKDNNYLIASNSDGIYISHDFGTTWRMSQIKVAYATILAEFDGIIYLNQDLGLYKSSDFGETWQYFFSSDDTTTLDFSDIYCFDNNLFVSAYVKIKYKSNQKHNDGKGIYFSSDKGQTWEKKCDAYANSFARFNDKLYFISGNYDTCTINSIDITGENCQRVYAFHDTIIWKITSCENYLYAGTDKYGLLFSSDSGKSWKAVTDSSINLYAINHIFTTDKYIYIDPGNHDYSSGLYRSKLKDCKIDFSSDAAEQHAAENVNIYPNPVTDFIEISVGVNVCSPLQSDVRIFDVFGQNVSTPVCSADTPASGGQVRIDVSGLAPGMYFVRVGYQVGKFVKI